MPGWRKSGGSGGKRSDDSGRGDSARGGSDAGDHSRRPGRLPSGTPEPQKPAGSKSSWRKRSSAAAGVPSAGGERYYRRTGGFFGFLFGRRQKLWVLGCMFSLLLAGIVWTLLRTPTRVPIVAVAITRYDDPLIPQNFTASRNLERFEHLASQTRDFVSSVKTIQGQFTPELRKILKNVAPGGKAFSRKSVILYISAHGVVNQHDKPCLLMSDSSPVDDTTWYPLSELLDTIKQEPGIRDATKLLVLDCCRIRSDWHLGILDNRFVDVLQRALDDADDPNLCLLTSADSGQRAWSAPEFGGGTVFGHFLVRGLRGAVAENRQTKTAGVADFLGKDTFQIAALEKYIADQVSHWVAATRSCQQVPRLITPKNKPSNLSQAVLAWISRGASAEQGQVDEPRDRSGAKKTRETLERFWAEHERLQGDRVWTGHPVGWAEFELHLLRLEELYLDGVDEPEAVDTASKAVETALGALQDRPVRVVFPGSIPLSRHFSGRANEASETGARSDLEKRKGVIKQWDAAGKPDPATLAAGPAPDLDSDVWQWLAKQPGVTRAQLAEGRKCLDKARGIAEGPERIESCFLRMLDRHLDAENPQLAQAIGKVIRARRQVEELAATADPRVLNWIRSLLDQADRERRRAEDLLFVGNQSTLDQADELWNKLLGAQEIGGDLKNVQDRKAAIEAAFRERDAIWTRVAAIVRWLDAEGATLGKSLDATIAQSDELIGAAVKLSEELETIHDKESPLPPDTSIKAGRALEELLAYVKNFAENVQDGPEDARGLGKTGALRKVGGLLASPLVSGGKRTKLRNKFDSIIKNLVDAQDALLSNRGETAASVEQSSLTREQWNLRLREIVEKLLSIAPDAGDAGPNRENSLTQAENGIRRVLGETPAQIRQAATPGDNAGDENRATEGDQSALAIASVKDDLRRRKGPSAADLVTRRRAWFVPRLESIAKRQDKSWLPPASRLMQLDLAVLALWHCDRALDDFWGPVPDSSDHHFYFARAAREYLSLVATGDLVGSDRFLEDRKTRLQTKLDSREKSARLIVRPGEKNLVFEADVAELKQSVTLEQHGLPGGYAAVYLAQPDGGELDRTSWHRAGDHPQVWRQAVEVAAGPSRKVAEFTVGRNVVADLKRPRKLAAAALYRGHVSASAESESFLAQLRVERDITPLAAERIAPLVEVKGTRHTVTELLFIMDASGSMDRAVGGGKAEISRAKKWYFATEALRRIVDELLAREDKWKENNEEWRVGLMVYGHRANWPDPLPAKFSISEVRYNQNDPRLPQIEPDWRDYDKKRPEERPLFPYNDVETFVEMVRFKADVKKAIDDALDNARPFGVTPLYYSLNRAISDFTTREGNVRPEKNSDKKRQIILITDGADYQSVYFDPTHRNVRTEDQQVMRRLREAARPIQIDVVGFDLDSEDKNKIKILKAFLVEANRLADPQDPDLANHFHDAHNSGDLVRSILKALDRDRLQYRVVRQESSATAPETWQPTNSVRNVIDPESLPAPFRVDVKDRRGFVGSRDVRLEGGEFLGLIIKDGKLEFEPFIPEKGLVKQKITVGPIKNRLAFHLFSPVALADDDVMFEFGVQYEDATKFTPRPSDVWAEITPLRSDDDGGINDPGRNDAGRDDAGPNAEQEEPAVFFDRSFAVGQRVPVVQFKFPNWPRQAKSARVQFWLCFPNERGRSPIERVKISFAQALKDSQTAESWTAIANSPASIHVAEAVVAGGVTQIVVSEKQPDDGQAADWCRIELSSPQSSVVRRYFLGEHRAKHVFEFNDGLKPDSDDLEIFVTPGSLIKGDKACVQIPGDGAIVPVRLPGNAPAVK